MEIGKMPSCLGLRLRTKRSDVRPGLGYKITLGKIPNFFEK